MSNFDAISHIHKGGGHVARERHGVPDSFEPYIAGDHMGE
jgi:hypothetical protein